MHAVAAHATEREAHIREIERYGQHFPEGSWAQRNRQAIATRETRVATRLRALEHAYRLTTEHDSAAPPSGPASACRPVQHVTGQDIELE